MPCPRYTDIRIFHARKAISEGGAASFHSLPVLTPPVPWKAARDRAKKRLSPGVSFLFITSSLPHLDPHRFCVVKWTVESHDKKASSRRNFIKSWNWTLPTKTRGWGRFVCTQWCGILTEKARKRLLCAVIIMSPARNFDFINNDWAGMPSRSQYETGAAGTEHSARCRRRIWAGGEMISGRDVSKHIDKAKTTYISDLDENWPLG